MKLVVLLLIWAVKILLVKALAVGMLLLFFYVKGKTQKLDDKLWNQYFQQLSDKKMMQITACVYGCASVCAAAICFGLLHLLHYRYALQITLVMLLVGVAGTAWRFHKKKEDLHKHMEQIRRKATQTNKDIQK